MESAESGIPGQDPSVAVAKTNRPAPAKKPKPPLPQKPPVAQKPDLVHINSNSEQGSSPESKPTASKPVTNPAVSRPKEAPPPLPRTPPKGPATAHPKPVTKPKPANKALCSPMNHAPSANVSVDTSVSLETTGKDISTSALIHSSTKEDSSVTKENTHICDQVEDGLPSPAPKPVNRVPTAITASTEKVSSDFPFNGVRQNPFLHRPPTKPVKPSSPDNTSSSHDAELCVDFDLISHKDTNTLSNESELVLNPSNTKIKDEYRVEKPKKKKEKDSSTKLNAKKAKKNGSVEKIDGASKWYVAEIPHEDTELATSKLNSTKPEPQPQSHVKLSPAARLPDCSDKSIVPSASPPVPRKPSPKVPPKTFRRARTNTDTETSQSLAQDAVSIAKSKSVDERSKNLSVQNCDKSELDNHVDIDRECMNTFHEGGMRWRTSTEKLDENANQDVHFSANTSLDIVCLRKQETEAEVNHHRRSSEGFPVAAPRNPAARPRPTPRKRLSLHRLSDTDQLSLNSGSLQNLSTGYELNHCERDVKNSAEDSTANVELPDKEEVQTRNRRSLSESVTSIQNELPLRCDRTESPDIKRRTSSDKTFVRQENVDENGNNEEVGELRKTDEESKSDPSKHSENFVPNSLTVDAPTEVHQRKPSRSYSYEAACSTDISDDKSEEIVIRGDENLEKSKFDSKEEFVKTVRTSLEDLLADPGLCETTSLLNEIEEILSRSYKHASLPRSEKLPEKTMSYDKSMSVSCEHLGGAKSRSLSVDSGAHEQSPVRPPRPKREKRLRSRSQIVSDEVTRASDSGSDSQSLSVSSDSASQQEGGRPSGQGKKAAPPKPKRKKLLSVQRSHSDVTQMKKFISGELRCHDGQDRSPKRQASAMDRITTEVSSQGSDSSADSGVDRVNVESDSGRPRDSSTPVKSDAIRSRRPTRKAPAPPDLPARKSVGPTDLSLVVPVQKKSSPSPSKHETGVKIKKEQKGKMIKKDVTATDTSGSQYSYASGEFEDGSDDDHDYHEIPEDLIEDKVIPSEHSSPELRKEKSPSPPKLPPRNSSSHSGESSSQSSLTFSHELDCTVSIDASSLDEDTEYLEPASSNRLSVEIKGEGFGQRLEVNSRPVSGISIQSDSGSHMSSSDSEGEEDEEKRVRKKEKKLFMIAKEIVSSEKVFVDVLKLLNMDFRMHISSATEMAGRPVIPNDLLNRILDYLPQLQNFNEDLLKDLEERLKHWDEHRGVSDIFVKKGPFLKLYSSYIRDFETMTALLDDSVKKYPAFQAAVREFEMSPRCAHLALKHYMLKPIQRIPQYRLLLQDYMKHLPEDSPELKDMHTALNIVSEVAEHANENMRHGDYVQKMLEIQRSLIGQFEVIKPGRTFLKEGELMKLSRKEMQPRMFFLFNDVLLYTTPVATGYRLNNVLPLAGMKVSKSSQDEYKTELSIISVQRSFTLAASTCEERDGWYKALHSAIDDNMQKRNTFEAVRAGAQSLLDKDFVLGSKAPIWIPDARVTMCMQCTYEFSITWRRHHCRACGKVVCGNCSANKAPLRYLKYKAARVCDDCYKTLLSDELDKGNPNKSDNKSVTEEEDNQASMFSIGGLLERFQKIRRSGRQTYKRPAVLKEVRANDQGAAMSGYLKQLSYRKKWKKLWFVLKDRVLYTYKASEDMAAIESLPILGYEVSRFTEFFEGVEPALLFQLVHQNTAPLIFRTDSATATDRWVTVMRESSVA